MLTIDDVTERFNVTSKTIQRWRRKGLPARRFVFPDGKRRVGFLLSSVERFFAGHQDQVAARDELLAGRRRRARRDPPPGPAAGGRCATAACTRSRGASRGKLNRSPLTILHTIRKHDQEHPDDGDLPAAPAEPIGDEERARILKRLPPRACRSERSPGASCRPRSAVYRVILEERIAQAEQAQGQVHRRPAVPPGRRGRGRRRRSCRRTTSLAASGARRKSHRVPRDLPPYLAGAVPHAAAHAGAGAGAVPEVQLPQVSSSCTARRKLEPQFARARDLNVLEGHLRRATDDEEPDRPRQPAAGRQRRPQAPAAGPVADGTDQRRQPHADAGRRELRRPPRPPLQHVRDAGADEGLRPQRAADARRARAAAAADDGTLLAEVPDARVAPARRPVRSTARKSATCSSRLDDRERDVVLAHYGIDDGRRTRCRRRHAGDLRASRPPARVDQAARPPDRAPAPIKLRAAAGDPS